MNRTEYILTCIAEECAEIIKVCSKANRFGLDDMHPKTKRVNYDALIEETNDLLGALELLSEEGFDMIDIYDESAIDNKKDKIKHYMKYSEEKGLLK